LSLSSSSIFPVTDCKVGVLNSDHRLWRRYPVLPRKKWNSFKERRPPWISLIMFPSKPVEVSSSFKNLVCSSVHMKPHWITGATVNLGSFYIECMPIALLLAFNFKWDSLLWPCGSPSCRILETCVEKVKHLHRCCISLEVLVQNSNMTSIKMYFCIEFECTCVFIAATEVTLCERRLWRVELWRWKISLVA